MINITTKVTYIHTIKGVTSISYELKEMIVKFLKRNTSKSDVIEVDFNYTGSDDIIVTSSVNFPQMKIFELQEEIPKMIKVIKDKENKKKNEDKEFVENWKKIKMAPNVYKNPILNMYVDSANRVFDNVMVYKREKDWGMARCSAADYEDLLNILTLIEKSEYKEAYFEYRHMDTAVREWVPDSVVQMLIDKAGM